MPPVVLPNATGCMEAYQRLYRQMPPVVSLKTTGRMEEYQRLYCQMPPVVSTDINACLSYFFELTQYKSKSHGRLSFVAL